nr:MAG TPA: hypothetical protein [Caudoviricetes sp.]
MFFLSYHAFIPCTFPVFTVLLCYYCPTESAFFQ